MDDSTNDLYIVELKTDNNSFNKKQYNIYSETQKNSDKGETLGEIAEKYNCSITAIRCSVISVKNKLSRLN